MQKKDDKVGNKTANKEGKKRSREKDRNRFGKKKSKFWLLRMCEKQKSCLITSDKLENVSKNSFLAIVMLIS